MRLPSLLRLELALPRMLLLEAPRFLRSLRQHQRFSGQVVDDLFGDCVALAVADLEG